MQILRHIVSHIQHPLVVVRQSRRKNIVANLASVYVDLKVPKPADVHLRLVRRRGQPEFLAQHPRWQASALASCYRQRHISNCLHSLPLRIVELWTLPAILFRVCRLPLIITLDVIDLSVFAV